MKSVFEMTGVERAAALLVALGPDNAADILKHLDENSIDRLAVEMAKIHRLSPADREDLIGEFLIDLKKEKKSIRAGKGKAHELLQDAFGKEKADSILEKMRARDVTTAFGFLQDVEPEIIYSFIQKENPQTIAVILQYLPSEKSAVLLKSFPTETAKDIAIRMAKTTRVVPEAIVGIADALRKKFEEYMNKNRGLAEVGGIDSLVQILQHMSGDEENKLIKNIDIAMPDVSEKIRAKIYSFDNVINLTNKEMRIVIDEINDDTIIAKALKGAGDEIRFKFVRNMSQNRATDILNNMTDMGPIRLAEVEDCRKAIVQVMKALHNQGVIILRKEGEQLVE